MVRAIKRNALFELRYAQLIESWHVAPATHDQRAEQTITQDALCGVRNLKNPFQYGSVVERDAFCNRKRELADLLRAIENCEKLFVYSERRFGKTSLVQLALGKLPKKGYVTAYIDLRAA